jgi:hypothetical protein
MCAALPIRHSSTLPRLRCTLYCSGGGPAGASGGKAAGAAAGLLEAPVNSYFQVAAGILPEATAEFYQDPLLKVGGRLRCWLLPAWRHPDCRAALFAPHSSDAAGLPRALPTSVGVCACLHVCLRLQGENVHEPNYGCRGVQQEWEFSGRRSLMARECMHTLARTLQVRAAGSWQGRCPARAWWPAAV